MGDCGCVSFECRPLDVPVCGECYDLVEISKSDDGCPVYECHKPQQTCEEGFIAKLVENVENPACPIYECCEEFTRCIDKNLEVRQLGETFQYCDEPCTTYVCDATECGIIKHETTQCEKPPMLKEGEFLKTIPADAKKCECCPRYEILPCNCCTEKENQLSCPKIADVNCGKCEVLKTGGLVAGTECCCPAFNECVPKLCPAIKVASCRKCEMLVEVEDECGCKSTICKPLPTPTCPACCKLLCSGTDKFDPCPI